MAGESVARLGCEREARTQGVPSAKEDGGHPPKCGDGPFGESPFSIRDLLLETDGLYGFIMRFLEQHAGHDWTLVHVPAEGVNGIFCRTCRSGKVYRPKVAAARQLALLDSVERG